MVLIVISRGVADAPKSNEVDITEVKRMLDNREKVSKTETI